MTVYCTDCEEDVAIDDGDNLGPDEFICPVCENIGMCNQYI